MRENFAHTGRLVRFMLRRERIVSTIWIVSIVLFSVALAPGMAGLFDADARQQFAEVYNNPVMVGMLGPIYGADNYTAGAMYGGMMLLWISLTAAIMNVFIVARHTRADEERWRAEVVRSLPVGRLANINAAMILALILNFILAVTLGLGVFAAQVESMDFISCMLYGMVTGAVGLVFAAITAVFCQLSSNTGSAMGLSFLSLGVCYMLRAAGDASMMNTSNDGVNKSNEFLSYISPLGLAQRSKVFVENDFVPLIFLIITAILISLLAFKLNSVRDLGQGFIPARPGRKTALPAMLSPFGFSFRLLSTMILVWVIVMFSLGASYGSVIGDVPGFVSESPEYLMLMGVSEEMAEHASDEVKAEMIVDGFGTFVTSMMTLIAMIPLLMAALKLRSEEKEGRAENILSRSVSKTKYLCCFTTIAFALSAIMQLATLLGLYYVTDAVTSANGVSNPFVLEKVFKASMAYLPALWIIIGFAVLLVGFFPKATGVIWGFYGFICFTTLVGGMGILPNWLEKISPMAHIPIIRVTDLAHLQSDEVSILSLAVMSGIALLLTTIGFIGYSRRDLLTH
ncbi:MAG: hypothetical protein FWG70_09655 [Oscillospiraceae bacterium]|nr:hypothetical protein [Oscillospiraceae bacterium]